MTKVLHVVENFDGQATEKWLYEAFYTLHDSGNAVDWSFFCTLDSPGKFGNKFAEKGVSIYCSPVPVSKLFQFIKFLRNTLRHGSYDVMHCHQDLMSAVYLLASIGLPIRKRIVHVHNTSLSLPTPNRLKLFVFRGIFRIICNQLADHIVGVSEDALKGFQNGKKYVGKCKYSVIHCSVNLDPIDDTYLTAPVFREQHGIPTSALVMLFVGRLTTYKNPAFVLDIISALHKHGRDVFGVFVGEGALKQAIIDLAKRNALNERVMCLGWRNDVREIMAACDVLIFPSLENPKEGLGLTVVEAQSVGLPVVMSLSVPDEAIVIPELVERISLKVGAEAWAAKICSLISNSKRRSRYEYELMIKNSSFSPQHSSASIVNLYK